MTLSIAGVEIGAGQPTRFVAEISNNHNGSDVRARQLIWAAKDAGADFVKFQAYRPSELVALRGDGAAPEPWGSLGWTMERLYAKAQTPLEWFPLLVQSCKDAGIPWFSSVFGAESLSVLEYFNCPAYKIARLDVGSALWMDAFATGKPLVMSFGPNDEINYNAALKLWCPEKYPQTPPYFDRDTFLTDDVHRDTVQNFDGFSYHGTSRMPCVTAATLGAKLIEAHFQLDDEPSELEANVSLTASEFRKMVDDVRAVEEMIA